MSETMTSQPQSNGVQRRHLLGGAAAAAAALVGSAVRAPGTAYGATAPMEIESDSPSTVPLAVKGAAGQTADLQQWRDSAGTPLARITRTGALIARQAQLDTRDQGPTVSPELHFKAANGFWLSGIDWTADVPARDFVVSGKVDHPTAGTVKDFIYCSHRGTKEPTVTFGNSAIDPDAALATFIGPTDGTGAALEPTLAGVLIRHMSGSTAPALMMRPGWSGANLFAVLPDGSVELRDQTNQRTLLINAATGAISARDTATPVSVRNSLAVRGAPGAGSFAPLVTLRQSGETAERLRIRGDGAMFWGSGTALDTATKFGRFGPGLLRADGKLVAAGGVGVGNSVAATATGKLTRKVEVFDGEGRSLGFVPIYSSIS